MLNYQRVKNQSLDLWQNFNITIVKPPPDGAVQAADQPLAAPSLEIPNLVGRNEQIPHPFPFSMRWFSTTNMCIYIDHPNIYIFGSFSHTFWLKNGGFPIFNWKEMKEIFQVFNPNGDQPAKEFSDFLSPRKKPVSCPPNPIYFFPITSSHGLSISTSSSRYTPSPSFTAHLQVAPIPPPTHARSASGSALHLRLGVARRDLRDAARTPQAEAGRAGRMQRPGIFNGEMDCSPFLMVHVCIYSILYIPVVPHNAVAEVSEIGNL